eukprot:scaffold110418_cov29-Tisochrysis_lutea.AAC.2
MPPPLESHGKTRPYPITPKAVSCDCRTQVCGSLNVVVHFSHPEFFRCRIVDKHLRILAPKYTGTKVCASFSLAALTSLGAQANRGQESDCDAINRSDGRYSQDIYRTLETALLPAVLVFKDGVKGEQLFGFEDIGGKDDFRTEVRGAACSWGYTSWAY